MLQQGIREPVSADKYYPARPDLLRAQLDAALEAPAPAVRGPHLQPAAARRHSSRLAGLIVPHGSLQDSGHVAAAAYALLGGSAGGDSGGDGDDPLRALLLGTNHFTNEPAAGLSSAAAWRTPLGDVPVDAGLSAALAGAGLPVADGPHNREHSAENQLPFLQHVLAASGRALTIAPVIVGWLGSSAAVARLARALGAVLGPLQDPPPLLIATSDFTHAGPSYREPLAAPWMSLREHCLWRDSPLLHAVCTGGSEGFLRACEATGTSLCGRWPVATFLHLAEERGWELELLSYAPSDLYVQSGDINGFAAWAAWEPSAA